MSRGMRCAGSWACHARRGRLVSMQCIQKSIQKSRQHAQRAESQDAVLAQQLARDAWPRTKTECLRGSSTWRCRAHAQSCKLQQRPRSLADHTCKSSPAPIHSCTFPGKKDAMCTQQGLTAMGSQHDSTQQNFTSTNRPALFATLWLSAPGVASRATASPTSCLQSGHQQLGCGGKGCLSQLAAAARELL